MTFWKCRWECVYLRVTGRGKLSSNSDLLTPVSWFSRQTSQFAVSLFRGRDFILFFVLWRVPGLRRIKRQRWAAAGMSAQPLPPLTATGRSYLTPCSIHHVWVLIRWAFMNLLEKKHLVSDKKKEKKDIFPGRRWEELRCDRAYRDVLASPVALLPPVDRSGPVYLQHSGWRSGQFQPPRPRSSLFSGAKPTYIKNKAARVELRTHVRMSTGLYMYKQSEWVTANRCAHMYKSELKWFVLEGAACHLDVESHWPPFYLHPCLHFSFPSSLFSYIFIHSKHLNSSHLTTSPMTWKPSNFRSVWGFFMTIDTN